VSGVLAARHRHRRGRLAALRGDRRAGARRQPAAHGARHAARPRAGGLGGGIGASHDAAVALADDFHVYAVDWTADRITWSLDGAPYSTLARADLPARAWAVDGDCYLLVNLAIGGAWPGNAFDPAALPATLLVDWVRVRSPRITVGAS
jgi:hypothetical protein